MNNFLKLLNQISLLWLAVRPQIYGTGMYIPSLCLLNFGLITNNSALLSIGVLTLMTLLIIRPLADFSFGLHLFLLSLAFLFFLVPKLQMVIFLILSCVSAMVSIPQLENFLPRSALIKRGLSFLLNVGALDLILSSYLRFFCVAPFTFLMNASILSLCSIFYKAVHVKILYVKLLYEAPSIPFLWALHILFILAVYMLLLRIMAGLTIIIWNLSYEYLDDFRAHILLVDSNSDTLGPSSTSSSGASSTHNASPSDSTQPRLTNSYSLFSRHIIRNNYFNHVENAGKYRAIGLGIGLATLGFSIYSVTLYSEQLKVAQNQLGVSEKQLEITQNQLGVSEKQAAQKDVEMGFMSREDYIKKYMN